MFFNTKYRGFRNFSGMDVFAFWGITYSLVFTSFALLKVLRIVDILLL